MASFEYDILTGVITPDTSDLYDETVTDYKNSLGDNLDISPETPQGRLIEAETNLKDNVINFNVLNANMINPSLAYGSFLDSICALTQCERIGATRSSVLATIGGVSGTVINSGSRATTTNGDDFYLENDVTIPVSGSINALFLSEETGAIPCALNTLTKITDGVIGWETIDNDFVATLGADKESDLDLKKRRKQTLYTGSSMIANIKTNLLNTDNVQSVYVNENTSSSVVTIDGVEYQPHSVYCCVYGGDDYEVAYAIYEKKSGGCAYTGGKTVTVYDEISGQPSDVKFSRPDLVYLDCKVTVVANNTVTDVTTSVKEAISDYQLGNIYNVSGLNIGDDVSPFEIASAVSYAVNGIYVSKVEIALEGDTLGTTTIEMNSSELARIPSSNINVVIS